MASPFLFDDEFLKKLEYLNIVSKRLFAGQFKAERRAKRRGAGQEFADFRAYVPGDDFRHLDWKAFLRLGKLVLRLYQEEEDLPIYFFLDSSKSMDYGSPSKLDYGRQITAALCYIGLANLDRVSIISYADKIKSELQPQRGKSRIFKIFRFLTEIAPGGETNARESFKGYATGARRRGLAVIISDCFDREGFETAVDILRHAGHDVFVVHIASHEEFEPAVKGELVLVDSENNFSREVAVTPALLAAYQSEYNRFCDQVESYCGKYHLGYVRVLTDYPFEDLVMKVFRQGRFLK
jgi:uncharacterized protein (DUF58 family)